MELPGIVSELGVYSIRNLVNGKMYVGSSMTLRKRLMRHVNSLNKGKHHSIKLQRAWDKYGGDSFKIEILEYVESTSELLEAEQMYLTFFECATECGYNVCPVAGSPHAGRKHTEETRAKMRESQRKRAPISEETRKRMSESSGAAKRTQEARARQSEISKNLVISPETRKKMADAKRGKPLGPHTEEAKAKMSEAAKERWKRRKQLAEVQNGL